jgi:hypothetical protein
MQLNIVIKGAIALMTTLPISLTITSPMKAQCVMNDVNLQVSMSGSKKPTQRTNNVTQVSRGPCVGNTITTTNTQVYTGRERATQLRESYQVINNQGSHNSLGSNTVKVKTNVQVDVYNPAANIDPTTGKILPNPR